MGKIRRLLLAFPIFFVSGCLCPYWVSPSVHFVPPARVNESGDSVYAFRVDTRQSTVYFPGPLGSTHQLTPIFEDQGGKLPGQLQVSCTRGFLALFVALNYCTWRQDTLSVRLYRPGYKTVELQPSMFSKEVHWKTAPGAIDQCKAIDDLVAGALEPGGVAKGHRTSLKFAAGEYMRLANRLSYDDPQPVALRQQLLEKAERLEKQAAESPSRGWVERLLE